MFTAEYKGINSFLVGASNLLLNHGVKRVTRNYVCWELPGPFMFKITNPRARLVTISARNWNPILPYAESLWIALGRNDLHLIQHYLRRMGDFSDDGIYLRGGYGPRLRRYSGVGTDYQSGENNTSTQSINCITDQLRFVVDNLSKDPFSRQAIVNLGDPAKDCFDNNGNIKVTKDFPCTRLLHFQRQSAQNKLDLTVYMRSNDLFWGASAVNIFNFTFMQEYVAYILGMELGNYYHIANNFHYYEDFKSQLELIAKIGDNIQDQYFEYRPSFKSLNHFDELLSRLSLAELKVRNNENGDYIDIGDDFFNDWFGTFYSYNTKKEISFANPLLGELFKKYVKYDRG